MNRTALDNKLHHNTSGSINTTSSLALVWNYLSTAMLGVFSLCSVVDIMKFVTLY